MTNWLQCFRVRPPSILLYLPRLLSVSLCLLPPSLHCCSLFASILLCLPQSYFCSLFTLFALSATLTLLYLHCLLSDCLYELALLPFLAFYLLCFACTALLLPPCSLSPLLDVSTLLALSLPVCLLYMFALCLSCLFCLPRLPSMPLSLSALLCFPPFLCLSACF